MLVLQCWRRLNHPILQAPAATSGSCTFCKLQVLPWISCKMKVPVAVTRLPRGPDGSRGFDPNSLRFQALGPASLSSVGYENKADLELEQQSRVALRERYLRSLLAMTGRPVSFTMYERVSVTALFGASDIDILNFQVSELQTPLGTQREALLRCSDIIAYSFEL
ncbi:gem-associated protein 7-like isoform X2 [Sceloporus undulatus]|uniref:gem-associated protein 7-like isoform X2 n=1 Tax=Sceloporus undulatus TaxID=8520 RepID=UPI001C4BEE68|nr:gem-associated protein 7-like isoform X2 [Sceloporus undulatus]XP_042299638.1 gem-associated protein 7-like isoform X2 [Sceloporus undulatus]